MRLTGLRPENPVAVMAAYGALRLLPGALLRWDGTHPELRWDGDVIATLSNLVPERLQSPELNLIDHPRQKHIEKAGGYAAIAAQMPDEWLTAYAAETADGIAGTELSAYAGNYTMVRAVRTVVAALATSDIAERVSEALLGPWRYADIGAGVALGWDANARQDRAVLAAEPKPLGKDKPTILAANWLAWEAIPAWQMVNGQTPGIEGANGRAGHLKRWTYPTCAEWLSWDGLRALVGGWARMPGRELKAMGVRLWQSEIVGRKEGGEFALARTVSGAKTQRDSRKTQLPDVLIV
jgi:hypothetical protein